MRDGVEGCWVLTASGNIKAIDFLYFLCASEDDFHSLSNNEYGTPEFLRKHNQSLKLVKTFLYINAFMKSNFIKTVTELDR